MKDFPQPSQEQSYFLSFVVVAMNYDIISAGSIIYLVNEYEECTPRKARRQSFAEHGGSEIHAVGSVMLLEAKAGKIRREQGSTT